MDAEEPEGCVYVCLWDPYHQGEEVRHGLLVCSDCERPLKCIAHVGHGAMLADKTAIVEFEP